jgi:hypothetical protein
MILIISFFSSYCTSYAFFDSVFTVVSVRLVVGEWQDSDASADEASVADILTDFDSLWNMTLYRDDNRQIENTQPYLKQVLFQENSEVQILDEIFLSYTNGDIINTIKNYVDFAENFLVLDNSNPDYPVLAYPPPEVQVPYVSMETDSVLLPGESVALDYLIATANLHELIMNQNARYGITFSVSMYLPGTDISDFAIEILVDKNAFEEGQYFEYMYQMLAEDTEVMFQKVQSQKTNLVDVLAQNEFLSEVRLSETRFYQHQYPKPKFSGSWGRFNHTGSVYLNYPGEFIGIKNDEQVGLQLRGSGDGSKVTLNFSLESVYTINGSVPIIPIQIILSRGLGKSNPNQDNQMPVIEYRILGHKLKY